MEAVRQTCVLHLARETSRCMIFRPLSMQLIVSEAALDLILVSWAILVQSICPIGYFSKATGTDFAKNPWHYCLVSFFKATSFEY